MRQIIKDFRDTFRVLLNKVHRQLIEKDREISKLKKELKEYKRLFG